MARGRSKSTRAVGVAATTITMSQPTDSPRLYLGRISSDVRTEDIESLFKPFGRIVDVRLMGTFGFVELDSPRDAAAALSALNGQELKGERLIIEPAKPNPRSGRGPRGPPDSYGPPGRDRDAWGPPPRGGRGERGPLRRAQFRVLLSHLPPGLSWQAIKDLGRPHGTVVFADIDPTREDEGIIEYNFRDEMEAAVRTLEGYDFRGSRLRADPAEAPPPPSFEREDRWRGGGRGFDRGQDRGPPRFGDRRERFGDRRRDDRYRPRRDDRGRRDRSPRRDEGDRYREDRRREDDRRYDEDRRRDDDRRYEDDRRSYDRYERSPPIPEGKHLPPSLSPPSRAEVQEAQMEDV